MQVLIDALPFWALICEKIQNQSKLDVHSKLIVRVYSQQLNSLPKFKSLGLMVYERLTSASQWITILYTYVPTKMKMFNCYIN